MAHYDSNLIIESELNDRLSAIEDEFSSDVLVYIGPIFAPLDDFIRDSVEGIADRKPKLSVILETSGGQIDTARRIAETFRRFYDHVDFIIASHAMSAGTILAMSGDAIYMDYYSVLGPIDPQIRRDGSSSYVPALGYLAQYDRLIEKSATGDLTEAEMAFLLQKFDPAELYQYEQERELSVELLKEWLVNFKFKDWNVTEARKLPVTPEMRVDRAEEIARSLNDTETWHSHGRGITMPILQNKLNLKINDFGSDSSKNAAVRGYFKLSQDYMMRRRHEVLIHTRDQYVTDP